MSGRVLSVLVVKADFGKKGVWVSAQMPSWPSPKDLKLVPIKQGKGFRDEVTGQQFSAVQFP